MKKIEMKKEVRESKLISFKTNVTLIDSTFMKCINMTN